MISFAKVGTYRIADIDIGIKMAVFLRWQLYTYTLVAVARQCGVLLNVEAATFVVEAKSVAFANDCRSFCDNQRSHFGIIDSAAICCEPKRSSARDGRLDCGIRVEACRFGSCYSVIAYCMNL